ncbi:amino acid ABC transporter permease [Arthrobacter sp. M2012083]|uniref:amino acid ABC transporter permease n=1 Tax=Arthrobacter sp. M2012083 TaxID=1197706 RepID=UPI0002E966B4|nr:amino acid ABC transporter permease [Arthrobacter sp. M2012083]
MELYFGDLFPYAPDLFHGLWISVYLTIGAVVFGGSFGVALCAGKMSRSGVVRHVAGSYIEVIRNTPLLLQLYLIYFALPDVGVNLDPLWAGFIALSLNNAAYTAEIYRAGFESVPKGLKEAASALGLSRMLTFRHILLAPATRNVLPSLTNQTILLFLASSITSIIAVPDLTHVMMGISSTTFRTIEALVVGGAIYLAVSFFMAQGSRFIETRVIKWRVA